MKLDNDKILVTGADGFIGSHLVEELARTGHAVRAFVMYNSFNSWGWLDRIPADVRCGIEVFAGDVRDPYGVRQAVQGTGVVLHLAALIAIPFSYHSPQSYVETNILGTLNVLQAARDFGVKKLIQTSTSEVYGTAISVPIREDHPLQGQSPYSATKIGADQLALSFYRSFDTPVSILRPFNTYGPRQSARAVIPSIITQIANGRSTLKLGTLKPTRDFTFVSDTVRAFIAAAESDRTVGEVINVGNGFEIAIGDLANLIASVMGREILVETDPKRIRPQKSEVDRLCADTEKATALMGWRPSYAGEDGLKAGIKETVEWFSDRENLMGYKHDIYNI